MTQSRIRRSRWLVLAALATLANIAGWPKFTGTWAVDAPSIGDLDDDGAVEVVISTRLGYVHAWDSTGPTCIDDLAVSYTGGSITPAFTAVGDDERCGTAAAYDVVVNGAPVAGLAAPKAAGETESLTFSGPPDAGALGLGLLGGSLGIPGVRRSRRRH